MAIAVSSVVVAIFDVKYNFHLQLVPHISRDHQYWRLLVHHAAFCNSSELFLWELILYNIGVDIERQFGGVKYAVSFLRSFAPSLWFQFQCHTVGSGRPSLQSSIPIFQCHARHVSLSRFRGRLLKQIISLCTRIAACIKPAMAKHPGRGTWHCCWGPISVRHCQPQKLPASSLVCLANFALYAFTRR